VAVGGLTTLLVAERRQSGPERAAVAAATAWARAVDAHDLAAVQGSTLPSARVLVVGASGLSERPFRGRQFVSGGRLTFEEGLKLRIVGDPVPAGDLQVTMRTHVTCPDGDQADLLTVVTLRRVGDDVRVDSVVMTPAPDRAADL
jgi:hypothetical protein